MSKTIIFDTHRFVKRSTDLGLTPPLAEFLAEEYAAILDNNLATKTDIAKLQTDIAEIQKETAGLRKDIAEIRKDIVGLATKDELAKFESRLIKWFVGSLFLSAGLVVAGVGILVQVLLR